MKSKSFIISCICFLIPLILSIVFYSQLPSEIPVHFNAKGIADGYAAKQFALFGMLAFFFILHLFVCFMITKDPKSENMPNIMKNLTYFIVPGLANVIIPIEIAYALGKPFNTFIVISIILGILFIALGNYMPKVKSNYTMGIRTPWTLANEEVWNKTHRIGGYCFILLGLYLILSCFFFNIYLFLILIGIVVAVPFVYSYLLYKKMNIK